MRPALLILLMALTRSVAAAPGAVPLAQANADVDGDGRGDLIRIEATGLLVVELAGGGQGSLALGDAAHATLTAGGPRGHVVIAAMVQRGAGKPGEGIAAAWTQGRLAIVWRGEVGPVGRDGEHEIAIEATERGLVRYQLRRDVARCDGEPARLFVEGWDASRQAFRPVRADVRVPDAAPVLAAARAEAAAPARSLVFRPVAASSTAGAADAGELTPPRELADGDPATAWREDRGGDGRGEFVTFRSSLVGASAVALRIVPGDARDPRAFAAGNRVARLAVVGGGRAYWVTLPDGARGSGRPDTAYWVAFPEAIRGGCVTVVVAGVHRGAGAPEGGGETAIAELAVLGDADLAPAGGDAALAAQVAAGGEAAGGAARVLAQRGAPGAQALLAELGRPSVPPEARRRLFAALVANGDPQAGPALADALAGGLSEADRQSVETAIERMAALPVDGLRAVLAGEQADADGRAAAARLLGAARTPEAFDALLAAAGRGPARVRRAVALALGRGRSPALLAAAQAAADDGRGADLWRAVASSAREAPDRAALIAAMRERLDRSRAYEVRYRLVAGLGGLGEPEAIAAVRDALPTLGDDPQGAALRRVAAAALAGDRSPAADAVLGGLVGDRDPGVRLAAIKALADHATPAASGAATEQALGRVLGGDRWPELRRAATAALGARCPKPGPTGMLEGAADRDADPLVRGDALSALVGCGAPGVAARLYAVAQDGKADRELRFRAVDLLGALGDRAQTRPLLGLFGAWRRQAFVDDVALGLAVRAAVVLGRLGDPASAAALVDAAGDPAFPELQAAAASGLGELGPACPTSGRAVLDELVRSEQRSVALAARRARAMCGRPR